MPEFLSLIPPNQARSILLEHLDDYWQIEKVAVNSAPGRITAIDVNAPGPLPDFRRSTVDGFALVAKDTHGVSDSLPGYLVVVGEVPMGAVPNFTIQTGQCALIHTGGMLPDGADAVIMLENTQKANETEVEILKSLPEGENVIQVGEDVSEDQVIIPAGRQLRSVEIGGLMAFGIQEVLVFRPPLVGLISSGDEVVPPERSPMPGQVRDVNTYSLGAMFRREGGESKSYGIIPDQKYLLKQVAEQAMNECDIVIISAGSSASTRDLTVQVIRSLGEPGVLVHGVNLRPGKPTILAVCNGKAVIGLPGNPVSAFVAAWLFIVPVLRQLLHISSPLPGPVYTARLTINLPSVAGREDWIPVRIKPNAGQNEFLAEPVFGKSNLIFTLVRADGWIRIPPAANGLAAGERAEVYPLQ